MPRRIALLASLVLIAASAVSGAAKAKPVDDACMQASPHAAVCIGAQKPVEALAATCRRSPAPNDACANTPVGHDVRTADLAAYAGSWLHRTAQYQYDLGDTVPLGDALWLGTHNSFNSPANGVTLSHTDNNQQLTLTQQLDGDIRAIELDVHLVPGVENGGSKVVRVCHGRGPDEQHLGCTTEPLLTDVLPEITTWINAHRDQVVLLYLEDELGDPLGYDQTLAALDSELVTADGSSLIYRPDARQATAKGCTDLPLGVTRADVLAGHRNVILVGNCRSGWASDVFGWDDNHVESGDTAAYRPFPGCDATYDRGVYASKFVRYFEDSTWLSSVTDPADTPAHHAQSTLTPERVSAMVACGVNLFGFDQFDPNDGRVAAAIWSWAPGQPAAAGGCALQQAADGRWTSADCTTVHPAACRAADGGWTLSAPVAFAAAAAACGRQTFSAPRTAAENQALRTASAAAPVWLNPPAS